MGEGGLLRNNSGDRMADDQIQRTYRASQPPVRNAPGSASSSPSDPLAELARLIGQNDPFGEYGRGHGGAAQASAPAVYAQDTAQAPARDPYADGVPGYADEHTPIISRRPRRTSRSRRRRRRRRPMATRTLAMPPMRPSRTGRASKRRIIRTPRTPAPRKSTSTTTSRRAGASEFLPLPRFSRWPWSAPPAPSAIARFSVLLRPAAPRR